MKILKIDTSLGFFLDSKGEFLSVDVITKDDILRLVELTLESDVEIDEYDKDKIKHQAHQIIYKNIAEKLLGLKDRRQEFKDETERLYLQEYEKYKSDSAPAGF